GGVFALAPFGSAIYVGGGFTSIGGAARNHIASLDAGSGMARVWNPSASDVVYALAVRGVPFTITVYAGGIFNFMGNLQRAGLAAIDATFDGPATVLDWNPGANSDVRALGFDWDRVYAGGFFTTIGGALDYHAAALSYGNGQALWAPAYSDGAV